jgi:hypothetical protein
MTTQQFIDKWLGGHKPFDEYNQQMMRDDLYKVAKKINKAKRPTKKQFKNVIAWFNSWEEFGNENK